MNAIDQRLTQAAVLLQRQALLTEHLIDTQGESLASLSEALKRKEQKIEHVLSVYNYVFALIDHLTRYQKIAFTLPRLNHKSKPFKKLNSAFGKIKEVRNQFQHINNNIENDFEGPLLGAVCWGEGNDQFIATFHDIGRERSTPMASFSTSENSFTRHCCYIYNHEQHDLISAIEGMRSFQDFISEKIEVRVDGKKYDSRDHFAALHISINFQPQEEET